MENQVLKFNALIEKVLSGLVPRKIACPQSEISKYCEKEFEITNEDINYLKRFKVPAPKLCPTCRRQRRYVFINQIDIFKRGCGAPGHSEKVISTIPSVSPYVTYDVDYYRNGGWDPILYGKDFDSLASFFSQFESLRRVVPHIAITSDPSNINSDYSVNGKNLKNGYRVTGGRNSENIWYTVVVFDSREIMDGFYVTKCENCYEIVVSSNCYNSDFIYFSDGCVDCKFMYDCKNCTDCIGGVNLRNAKYVFWGEQLSKDEYGKRAKDFSICSRKKLEEYKNKFWDMVKKSPVRGPRLLDAPGCTGVLTGSSKNCVESIGCFKSEDSRYCDMLTKTKDAMDASASSGGEGFYQTISVGSDSSDMKFSVLAKNSSQCEFVINCKNCTNCFACVGLENKSYSIFNKQYEKEEYFKEIDKIKSQMLEKGEYGEFLPTPLSCFAYNTSNAYDCFPLTQQEAKKLGSFWQLEEETDTAGSMVISVNDLPDDIKDVDGSILKNAIKCKVTGKLFRIVATELEYLKKRNIALPTVHPKERMLDRFAKISSYRKNKDVCQKCGVSIESIYPNDAGWIVWCDDCYKKEFI